MAGAICLSFPSGQPDFFIGNEKLVVHLPSAVYAILVMRLMAKILCKSHSKIVSSVILTCSRNLDEFVERLASWMGAFALSCMSFMWNMECI